MSIAVSANAMPVRSIKVSPRTLFFISTPLFPSDSSGLLRAVYPSHHLEVCDSLTNAASINNPRTISASSLYSPEDINRARLPKKAQNP